MIERSIKSELGHAQTTGLLKQALAKVKRVTVITPRSILEYRKRDFALAGIGPDQYTVTTPHLFLRSPPEADLVIVDELHPSTFKRVTNYLRSRRTRTWVRLPVTQEPVANAEPFHPLFDGTLKQPTREGPRAHSAEGKGS